MDCLEYIESMVSLKNSLGKNFGPLQTEFSFNVENGYTTLVGENDLGKSAILQILFREASSDEQLGLDAICYIPANRDSVAYNTEMGQGSLQNYNNQLRSNLANAPLIHGQDGSYNVSDLAKSLLNHTNFLRQAERVNHFLKRLGMPELELRENQKTILNNVILQSHGTGFRSIFSILTALTDSRMRLILIDEPERSLEPRLQKRLKALLMEECENRSIIVATHSHLMLNHDKHERNIVVVKSDAGQVTLRPINSEAMLMDVAFDLLGNSLQDLFLPGNFLIVEGASDQTICNRAAKLMGISSNVVKILSATGIDKTEGLVKSIENTLRLLIADYSPYAKRIVTLLDAPNSETKKIVADIQKFIGDRCFLLTEDSLEKYVPESLYQSAGLMKEKVLVELERAKGNQYDYSSMKATISNQLAEKLEYSHLENMPIVKQALEKAKEFAS